MTIGIGLFLIAAYTAVVFAAGYFTGRGAGRAIELAKRVEADAARQKPAA
jgi:hypothetical protein